MLINLYTKLINVYISTITQIHPAVAFIVRVCHAAHFDIQDPILAGKAGSDV